MDLERFPSVSLVSELLSQRLYDVTETILQSFVHSGKVGFLVQ